MIEVLKALVCMPFLLYSCYLDIKTRRVTNRLWPIMLITLLPFIIYDVINLGFQYIIATLLSFVLIFTFVYILFYARAFGGADAKIMIVLSLIMPIYPKIIIYGRSLPLEGIPPLNLFAFSVFGNAVILTIIVPLGLFIYNLTQSGLKETLKKPHYMFVGYRLPVKKLDKPHIRLLEYYEKKDGAVSHQFTRGGMQIDKDLLNTMNTYAKNGLIKDKVWVTPGIPFMIPITAGFITALIYGDIIFQLTSRVLL